MITFQNNVLDETQILAVTVIQNSSNPYALQILFRDGYVLVINFKSNNLLTAALTALINATKAIAAK